MNYRTREAGRAVAGEVVRRIHPKTIGRSLWAVLRGIGYFLRWSHNYVNATDKLDIKTATNGPVRHHEICRQRQTLYACVVLVLGAVQLALAHRVQFGWWIGPLAFVVAMFAWGRNEPVVVGPIQIGRNHTETLIKDITNQLTLTAEMKKNELSCRLMQPIHSIPSGTGYITEIELAGQSAKKVILAREDEFSAKLGIAEVQVHISPVKTSSSRFGLLILHDDPWDSPATASPLALNPRQIDLWHDRCELGTLPTSEPYSRWLQQEGGGGGGVIGAAPRVGKTNTANNIVGHVLLDPNARPLFIDGKGVDWKPCEPLAQDGRYITRDDRPAAIDTLKYMNAEVDRRSLRLEQYGLTHITQEVCKDGMPTWYLFLDETSIYTEDAPRAQRDEFLQQLGTLCRLGPTFGVYTYLNTQRPTEKGIPPGVRDLLTLRIALYSMTSHASIAILGAGGDANRADRLSDPTESGEQRGVAIVRGDGMIRTHLMDRESLARLARYAQSLRAQAGTPAGPGAGTRPGLVQTAIEILVDAGVGFMDSGSLVAAMKARDDRLEMDPNRLALAMKTLGVSPVQATTKEHPARLRGYRMTDLMAVPPVVRRLLSAVPNTAPNIESADHQNGREAQ